MLFEGDEDEEEEEEEETGVKLNSNLKQAKQNALKNSALLKGKSQNDDEESEEEAPQLVKGKAQQ
jgi:hypothetical protein